MKRYLWLFFAVIAILAVTLGNVPARFFLAPLLGLLILRIGLASFRSLRDGGPSIPQGAPPVPLQPEDRVTYVCGGCGAEVLLLTRGTDVPPRHCGEKMAARRESPALN